MLLQNALDRFLLYLTENNASPYTIRARKTALRSFIAFAATQGIERAEQVAYGTMADFTMHMGLRLSPLTRNQYISIMRVFFRYLCQSNHILYDPAERMESVKAHRILPEHVLSPADAEKILSGIGTTGPLGLRNRAILELLYSSGLRKRELCNLDFRDLSLDTGIVAIYGGKGNKDRFVPVTERAMHWQRRYLMEVRARMASTSEKFFLRQDGSALSYGTLAHLVRSAVQNADLGYSGGCHLFRHSMATAMLEAGCDLRFIQQMLGHASVATTETYTHVALVELRDAYLKFHPLGSLVDPLGLPVEPLGSLAEGQTFKSPILPLAESCAMPAKRENPAFAYAAYLNEKGFNRCIGLYLAHLHARDYSSQSLATYHRRLIGFRDYLENPGSVRIENLTRRDIEAYRDYLFTYEKRAHIKGGVKALAMSTQAHHLIVLKSFFGYLAHMNHITYNIAAGIAIPRVRKNLPQHILTIPQVLTLFSYPDSDHFLGLRDRAFLELLYATGLRRGEILALKTGDIKLSRMLVFVRSGKGGHDRYVPVTGRAAHWVTRYLTESRPKLGNGVQSDQLFLSIRGPMQFLTAGQIVRDYLRRLYDDPKFTGSCHILRQSIATHLLEAGMSSRYIQEFLGHKNLATTERYARVNIQSLKVAHRQAFDKIYQTGRRAS